MSCVSTCLRVFYFYFVHFVGENICHSYPALEDVFIVSKLGLVGQFFIALLLGYSLFVGWLFGQVYWRFMYPLSNYPRLSVILGERLALFVFLSQVFLGVFCYCCYVL